MMTPKTEAELADMISSASGPLAVQGGGTRGLTGAGDPLSTSGLSGINTYEPGALTVVARAGTPIAEIEKTLKAENQRLAFEPMDHRALMGTTGTPTLGGVFAANISGPRRIAVGAARDFALGVRFVDGTGQIIKNGGRVMKNVTGYDLVKLMCGSMGTLGMLSEISLKVLPMPETEATLILHNLDSQQAVAAMSAALGSPFEVSGAAHLTLTAGDGSDTMLRVEGFEASVAYRIASLREKLASFGDMSVVDAGPSGTAWASIRDVTLFAAQGTGGDVWRVSVKPSDAPGIIAAAKADDAIMDWGGGLVWLRMSEGTDLRARIGFFDGHATLVRGSDQTRAALGTFQPEPAPLAALSEGLRQQFDPRGLFNPGLMQAA